MLTTTLVLLNLVLTGWLLLSRTAERNEQKRAKREHSQRIAAEIQADRELLDRTEKENLAGPANPAVTAMIAGGRRTLERGVPMSAADRTFVTAAASQLGGINDVVSEIRLRADFAKKGRSEQ